MRLCVYAICKDEIDKLDAWLEAVKEADEIVVLDTGSTDGTWERLQEANIKSYRKIINPWRFDAARNAALDLIPEDCDICLPLDIDMLPTLGFADRIKEVWEERLAILNFKITFNKKDIHRYKYAHRRKSAYWVYPVYEQIRAVGHQKYIQDILLDTTWEPSAKHKAYLPLVELGLKEQPNNSYLLKAKEIIVKELNQLEEK